jgi:enamine deaminase RidA (YjgF/YER057c/UK114 family)
MEKKFINPPTLMKPRGYTHAVSVEGAAKMVFVSGQVACDAMGQVVGEGDLREQARLAFENLAAALKAAGAAPADVIKINTYVVNYRPEDYRLIREARAAVFPSDNLPASTLVGVEALAVDELLIEIEAVAAVK